MSSAEQLTIALGGIWHGSYGTARCPGPGHDHGDRHASLSIRDGDKPLLVKCHAGCCGPRTFIDELKRRGLRGDYEHKQLRPSPAVSAADRNRECALRIWGRVDDARALAWRSLSRRPRDYGSGSASAYRGRFGQIPVGIILNSGCLRSERPGLTSQQGGGMK